MTLECQRVWRSGHGENRAFNFWPVPRDLPAVRPSHHQMTQKQQLRAAISIPKMGNFVPERTGPIIANPSAAIPSKSLRARDITPPAMRPKTVLTRQGQINDRGQVKQLYAGASSNIIVCDGRGIQYQARNSW